MAEPQKVDRSSIKSYANSLVMASRDVSSNSPSMLDNRLESIRIRLSSTEKRISTLQSSMAESHQSGLEASLRQSMDLMITLEQEFTEFSQEYKDRYPTEKLNPGISISIQSFYYDHKRGAWGVKLYNKSEQHISKLSVFVSETNEKIADVVVISPKSSVKKFVKGDFSDQYFYRHLIVKRGDLIVSNSFTVTPIIIKDIVDYGEYFEFTVKNVSFYEFKELQLVNSERDNAVIKHFHNPPTSFEKKRFKVDAEIEDGYYYFTENGNIVSGFGT